MKERMRPRLTVAGGAAGRPSCVQPRVQPVCARHAFGRRRGGTLLPTPPGDDGSYARKQRRPAVGSPHRLEGAGCAPAGLCDGDAGLCGQRHPAVQQVAARSPYP